MGTGNIIALALGILNFIGIIVVNILSYRKEKSNLEFQKEQFKYQQEQKDREETLKKTISDRAEESDRKTEQKLNIIIEKQQELEVSFLTLDKRVEDHIINSEVKDTFEVGIYNATEGITMGIVKSNFTLNTSTKSILMKWGKLIHKLGADFHESKTRLEDELSRGDLLLQQQTLIMDDFNNFVNSKFSGIKIGSSKEKTTFSDLLVKKGVYSSFEILIHELEINGIKTDEEFIKKFEIQVKKFCKNLLVAIEVWNSMEIKTTFSQTI